jgi:N6-adenosine-specific RNA methylase IME4
VSASKKSQTAIQAAAVSAPSLPAIDQTFARKTKDGRWVGTGNIADLNRELKSWAARVGKADVILLDRPWAYGKEPGSESGESWAINPEQHYPVIADAELIQLALRAVLKPHAEVYEWVPASQVPFLLEIWRAAGVQFVSRAAWWKLKETGSSHVCSNQLVSNCHEFLAVGRVGKGVPRIETAAATRAKKAALKKARRDGLDDAEAGDDGRTAVGRAVLAASRAARAPHNKRIQRIPGVFAAPAGEHSRKPAEVYEWIRSIYGPSVHYGEIFARGGAKGWHVFGNQAAEDAA